MSTSSMTGLAVPSGEGYWTPPSSVTEHQGEALAADRDFFVAPPSTIGEVRTAHTSLKKGTQAKSLGVRAVIVAVVAVISYFLAVGFNNFTNLLLIPASMTNTPVSVWCALVALLPGYIAWRKTGFSHFCSFVGSEGCAEIQCKDARENITKNVVFLFRDARSVSVSVTRHIKNGRYNYTNYYFYWYPADGDKAIFEICSSHSADAKTPPPGNPYNFARSIESAWYDYLIPRAEGELSANGYINFKMGRTRHARVGRGFIEIVDKSGQVNRCEAGDIGTAKLEQGFLTICRKGATSGRFDLFSKEGVYRFDYGMMHNGRLFLIAFEKFLGVKVQ